MRARRLALTFAIALLVRLVYWAEVRSTALERWHEWDQTDMYTYLEQARRIAAGDWLGRDPFHPYHRWQHGAPAEQWLEWYPEHSFHQAPAYSYALAMLRTAGFDEAAAIRWLQLVLGALLAVVLHELARSIAGPVAGWVAGVIAATYGPLIQIEQQVLRDGPAALVTACVVGALLLHGRRPTKLGLAGIGALIGALTLLHEIGQVVLAAAAIAVIAIRSERIKAAGVAVACLVGGFALTFSPLLARNLIVGAPALSISSRSGIVFAMSNHALAQHGGARWGTCGPRFVEVMEQAQDSSLGVAGAVVRSYAGRWHLLPGNVGSKLSRVVAPPEWPDNTSYAFYRSRSRVLALAPGWWLIFAPGLAGLAMLIVRARTQGRTDAVTLAVFVLALGGALSLTHALGRLRLCIVPLLILLTGVAVGLGAHWASRRQWKQAVVALGALGAAVGLQVVAHGAVEPPGPRGADHYVAAAFEIEGGDLERGAADLERAIELGIDGPVAYRRLGEALAALGRDAEARQWLERAKAADAPP